MKRFLSLLLAAALTAGLCACSAAAPQSGEPASPEEQSSQEPAPSQEGTPVSALPLASPEYPEGIAYEDYEAQFAKREENAVDAQFVEALKEFTASTSARLLTGGTENKNYSPVSLYMALALAASGAEGDTAREMLSLLGAEESGADWLSEQTGRLYRLLYTDNEFGFLRIANSLWAANECQLLESYAENAAKNFYASSYSVDYSDPATGAMMSQWVSDNTGGTIVPAIEPSPETLLAIFNTVWLKDSWTEKFDPQQNSTGVFHTAAGQDAECEYMHRSDPSGGSKKGEGYLSASMSFASIGRMVFILPDEGVSAQELLTDPNLLNEAIFGEQDRFGEVVWQLPKFSFDTTMELNDTLKALGMESAFDRDGADFSGIAEQEMFVSEVKQQTHIAVDENGVEAAAFTSMMMKATGAGMSETTYMTLERPFIFAIVSDSGAVLFAGVVNDPTAN